MRLSIDWERLGISPSNAVMTLPAIDHFQPSAEWHPNDVIPVEAKKGWIIMISD